MKRCIHIAETFYDFVSDLRNPIEIKQVQKSIRLIKDDPGHPSLRRHKLDRIKANDIVSYSVNQDIRIISFEPGKDEAFLLYVNHHDVAYNWAQTKKISKDALTGILRLVPINREDIPVGPEVEAAEKEPALENKHYQDLLLARKPAETYLFDSFDNKGLMQEGIPQEYIECCRRIRDDQDVMTVLDHLPTAVGEAIFSLSAQLLPNYGDDPAPTEDAATNSVTQVLNFHKIETDHELNRWIEALEEGLKLDFQKWRSFLHPAQRKAVTAEAKGPIRITGAAGTGKTIVGIHRALHLRSMGFHKIHLLTYNRTLMRNLMDIVKDVFGQDLGKVYVINTFHGYMMDRLRSERGHAPQLGGTAEEFLGSAIQAINSPNFPLQKDTIEFLLREIVDVIAAQKIKSLSEYIRAPRKNTGVTLSVEQKEQLWAIYEEAWQNAITTQRMPFELLSHYAIDQQLQHHAHEALIIDEVQDLRAADLAFLAEQASGPNQLTLLEDAKQRIYGSGYSLKSLGINVTGKRSIKLFVNYRTTEEIGAVAHQSLKEHGLKQIDLPKSLRHGPRPETKSFPNKDERATWLLDAISKQQRLGRNRIAIVARNRMHLEEIIPGLQVEGLEYQMLERDNPLPHEGVISLCTMHNCKGLEFETVFVLDDSDSSRRNPPSWIAANKKVLQDYERKERHLLYVALSRARDELYYLLI
jgi:hypothetical protein